MGSVSFDGSLRIWDLRNNSLKSMFEDRQAVEKDKVLQCLCWYNNTKFSSEDPSRNLVVIGTSSGKIKCVDIEKNRVMWKEEFGEKQVIYDCDWSPSGILAVGGSTKELVLRKFDKSINGFQKH